MDPALWVPIHFDLDGKLSSPFSRDLLPKDL